MKYSEDHIFVFGGCYSNIQATRRLQEIATELRFTPDRIICTGDVVGYCAHPEETVSLIRDWGVHLIAGNVEQQLAEGMMDCGCNFDEGSRCDAFSKRWFPYAQQNLSPSAIEWMKGLPTTANFTRDNCALTIIHGGPEDISEFIFESTPKGRKKEIFDVTGADIILSGHSGLPFVQKVNGKLWVNAGVVGMPANDGTTRCWFAIVNTVTKTAEIHAFDYDNESASSAMESACLPEAYALTLMNGIWDNCEILPETETQAQGKAILADVVWASPKKTVVKVASR